MIRQSTIALIKGFEGCILKPYKDTTGVWTIGWGFTYDLHGNPVTSLTAPLTQGQADDMLLKKVQYYADGVDRAVKVPLNQNQYDACVSFTFNVGVGGFTGSTVCRDINKGDFKGAAQAFLLWNKPPEIMDRRNKERQLFITPVNSTIGDEVVK